MSVRVESVRIGDEPDAWRAAGFAVDVAGRCGIGTVAVQLTGEGTGYGSWRLVGAPRDAVVAIDGMTTELATVSSAAAVPSIEAHPNGARQIDHLVWLTPDGERTATAVTAATGAEVRRVRDAEVRGRPITQRFFRFGEVILEVTATEPPAGGPVGFFGVAVTVADLDAAVARLGAHCSEIRPAVQPGRRVATVRTRELGISVPLLLISPEERRATG